MPSSNSAGTLDQAIEVQLSKKSVIFLKDSHLSDRIVIGCIAPTRRLQRSTTGRNRSMANKQYPGLGGDLNHGLQVIVENLDAFGIVAFLNHGPNEPIETSILLPENQYVNASAFSQLANDIRNGSYSESLET